MGERDVPYYLVSHSELHRWLSPQLVSTHLFLVPFWAQIINLHVNLVSLTLPACESRWSLS